MKMFQLKQFQPTEYSEQTVFFDWVRMMSPKHPVLRFTFATLNGMRLTPGQAVKAKRAGMVAGVPDIIVPVPMYHQHGLVMELKRRKGGHITPEQEWWLAELRKLGWRAEVPAGAGEAISIVKEYLGI